MEVELPASLVLLEACLGVLPRRRGAGQWGRQAPLARGRVRRGVQQPASSPTTSPYRCGQIAFGDGSVPYSNSPYTDDDAGVQ